MQKISGTIIFMAALLLVATSVNVQGVSANGGSIKTVNGSCGSPVNLNHYVIGDTVFIQGAGFAEGVHNWSIEGTPGSNTPGPVTHGTETVDESGAFCFMAHVIGPLEGGVYKATFGNTGDNYQVRQVIEPEDPPVEPEDPGEPESPPPPVVASVPSQPVAQSSPAPVVAPTTGAASGPATLVISAASALGLSGLSLGAWLKRRKE
jgi:hypothetical protein